MRVHMAHEVFVGRGDGVRVGGGTHGGEFKCGCVSEFGHLIALGDGCVGDRIHETHGRIGMDSKAKRAALR